MKEGTFTYRNVPSFYIYCILLLKISLGYTREWVFIRTNNVMNGYIQGDLLTSNIILFIKP